MAVAADWNRFVTISADKTVKVWSFDASKHSPTFEGHLQAVESVAFSSDGSHLASGSWDGSVRYWDVASRQSIAALLTTNDWFSSVAFSPDDKVILAGTESGNVSVWDPTIPTQATRFSAHTARVTAFAFSPRGERFATVAYDGLARIWGSSTYNLIRTMTNGSKTHSLAWSSDGVSILCGSDDGVSRIWDANTGILRVTIGKPGSVAKAVAFSPDGKQFVVGGFNLNALIYDTGTGSLLTTLQGHSKAIMTLCFSPDGRRIVTGSWDGTVRIWDVETGFELLSVGDNKAEIRAVAFSPDGRRIAAGTQHSRIPMWEAVHTVDSARTAAAKRLKVVHRLIEQERLPEAERHLQHVINTSEGDSTTSVPLRYLLGKVQLAQSKYQDATVTLRDALDTQAKSGNPKDPAAIEAGWKLAESLLLSGDKAESLRVADQSFAKSSTLAEDQSLEAFRFAILLLWAKYLPEHEGWCRRILARNSEKTMESTSVPLAGAYLLAPNPKPDLLEIASSLVLATDDAANVSSADEFQLVHGLALLRNGRHREADPFLRRASDSSEEWIKGLGLLFRSISAGQGGLSPESRSLFNEAKQIMPPMPVRGSSGPHLHYQGYVAFWIVYDEAEQALRRLDDQTK